MTRETIRENIRSSRQIARPGGRSSSVGKAPMGSPRQFAGDPQKNNSPAGWTRRHHGPAGPGGVSKRRRLRRCSGPSGDERTEIAGLWPSRRKRFVRPSPRSTRTHAGGWSNAGRNQPLTALRYVTTTARWATLKIAASRSPSFGGNANGTITGRAANDRDLPAFSQRFERTGARFEKYRSGEQKLQLVEVRSHGLPAGPDSQARSHHETKEPPEGGSLRNPLRRGEVVGATGLEPVTR